jgi:hypothetical protein
MLHLQDGHQFQRIAHSLVGSELELIYVYYICKYALYSSLQ